MRIWDLPPKLLCRSHLLGEHRELHAVWNIITMRRKGYRYHPEVRRWAGKLKALYRRHEGLVTEMKRRGYRHQSPLPKRLATGLAIQRVFVARPETQKMLLRKKDCECKV